MKANAAAKKNMGTLTKNDQSKTQKARMDSVAAFDRDCKIELQSGKDSEPSVLQVNFDQLPSTSKRDSAPKKRKTQDTSIDNQVAEKKRCLDAYNALSPDNKNEIIKYLKDDEGNQNQELLLELCNSWDHACLFLQHKDILLKSIRPVSTIFDPDNFEYMTRRISLQDDDPRMGKTIYTLFNKMTGTDVTNLCQILDTEMHQKPYELMSYFILNKVGGERLTLEKLLKLFKDCNNIFSGHASVIESIKRERSYEKPRITNNKTILHILSKRQKELPKREINLLINLIITWCADCVGVKFLLCLFHTICDPKDSCDILEGHKVGKQTIKQAAFKIVEIMKEKERPIGDIFEVIYNLDAMGIMDDVEKWGDKNAALIPDSRFLNECW